MEPLAPARYREIVGRFPTGVAVVTCVGDEGPAGLTTNALASLSLTPLLLLVCFDNDSRTLQAVHHARRFCVNVLGSEQEDIARVFASRRAGPEKLDSVLHRWRHEVPVVDGAAAWLVCDLEELLPGGDHTIGIGRVLDGGDDPTVTPLVFHGGDYGRLGAYGRDTAPPRPGADA